MRLPKRKRTTILDVMNQHRADVLEGEAVAVRRMLRAYDAAKVAIDIKYKRAQAILAAAMAESEQGKDYTTWLFQSERYQALLDEVQTQIDRFAAKAENITAVQQKNSAERGIRNAIQLIKIEIRGSGLFPTAFKGLNKVAVENMAGVFADGSPLRTLFGKMGTEARNKAHDIMVSGIASGENPRLMGKKLAAEIEDLSVERGVRIARNESLRVLTTSQQRTYEANSDVVSGSRIVSALDSRTCPMCWARHGQILKPGELLHRHVSCRCALAPVTEYSKRWATGPEEFALLDETKQLEILGRARFDLYKKGNLDLNDLYIETSSKWGPGMRYRNLSQIPKTMGRIQYPPSESVNSVIRLRREQGITAK